MSLEKLGGQGWGQASPWIQSHPVHNGLWENRSAKDADTISGGLALPLGWGGSGSITSVLGTGPATPKNHREWALHDLPTMALPGGLRLCHLPGSARRTWLLSGQVALSPVSSDVVSGLWGQWAWSRSAVSWGSHGMEESSVPVSGRTGSELVV